MSTTAIDALHDIHTATNDALKGYREMAERAQPDIQAIIGRLTTMHERHADEQASALDRAGDTGKDDTSLQGTVNKAVVTVRDWLFDLDRDALPAVRDGEESIRKEYVKALEERNVVGNAAISALLTKQLHEINSEISRLPQD